MKKIIYKNIVASKISLYIFILSFITIILNGLNLSINYINDKINNEILNKTENRSFYIIDNNSMNDIKTLENIDHIEYVSYDFQPIKVDYKNYSFYIKVFNRFEQKYTKVNCLKNNEIIISEAMAKQFHIKKDTTITVNFSKKNFEFKIKEIYNQKDNMGNYMYISRKNELIECVNDKNNYFVLIDDFSNYNEVINSLESYGCSLKFKNSDYNHELLTYKDILLNLNLFFTIIYIILFFCFFSILVLNIIEKKYDIALLKHFGYSNYKILKILIFEYLFLILVIYGITAFLFGIISCILFILEKICFFDIYVFIKNLMLTVSLLILICMFLILKIRKISLIKLLKC